MRCSIRVLSEMASLLVLGSLPVVAQEREVFPITVDVSGSVDWVFLYQGDMYTRDNSAWGVTGSLAFRSGFPLGAEIFLAFTASDDEQDSPTPRILLPGAWATLSLSRDPRESWDVFFAAGVAYLDISEWPTYPDCNPPECWIEGGPNIQNGGSWSVVWGGGATYTLPGRLRLRLDVRVPAATDEIESRTTRVGLGVGVRVR
ncbi:MAG: hypothetical protein HKO65_09240 [Gemmatimonadetes bacterium]|nr:porin family protein [Gemmatimonadota bacterium]NNM05274.1 hypothetical protein [Gemmatimonadota bacterium]